MVAASPSYSADRQQRFTIEHITLFPERRSSWSILSDDAPLPAAFREAAQWHRGKLPFSQRMRWMASAPAAPGIAPPTVQLLESVRNGDERLSTIRLEANGAERIALIAPPEAHIRSAGVGGFVRSLESGDSDGNFTISCTGRSCDGAELAIDLYNPKPVTFTVVASRNGLPASAAPLIRGRPAFARPQYTPDETVTVSHIKL